MVTRTIEINDTLDEIIESAKIDLKEMVFEYLNDNPDLDESPDLYNDLDYDGRFHELVDTAVPIYTTEINDLFYLYGSVFERAFEDAGIGDKDDQSWPMGWKSAAIYCYIEQELSEWFAENVEDLFDEWKLNHSEEIPE